jgi:hypothetical protein
MFGWFWFVFFFQNPAYPTSRLRTSDGFHMHNINADLLQPWSKVVDDDEYPAKGRHGLDCCPDMLCPLVVSRVPIFHKKSFNFPVMSQEPPPYHHSSLGSVSTLTKPIICFNPKNNSCFYFEIMYFSIVYYNIVIWVVKLFRM